MRNSLLEGSGAAKERRRHAVDADGVARARGAAAARGSRLRLGQLSSRVISTDFLQRRGGARAALDRKKRIPPPRSAPAAGMQRLLPVEADDDTTGSVRALRSQPSTVVNAERTSQSSSLRSSLSNCSAAAISIGPQWPTHGQSSDSGMATGAREIRLANATGTPCSLSTPSSCSYQSVSRGTNPSLLSDSPRKSQRHSNAQP